MNPAALKVHLSRSQAGRHPHRQHRRLRQAQPRQGRLRHESARGSDSGREVPPAPGRHDGAHHEGARGPRRSTRRRRTAARTSSRSASSRGSTRGRSTRPWTWIKKRFAKSPDFVEANTRVLKAGHAFGETAEIFAEHYGVEPAEMAPGIYRSMTGNRALAWGLLAAAQRTKMPIVFGAYPITPGERASSTSWRCTSASASGRSRPRTRSRRSRAAIGASFGGAIGVTRSSGPGIALKGEAHRAGGDRRAAAGDLRHPARRPEHRAADQDRAGRPDAGALRPQQRVAGRGDRAVHAGRLLLHRLRGGAASPSSTWCRSWCSPTAISPTARSRG